MEFEVAFSSAQLALCCVRNHLVMSSSKKHRRSKKERQKCTEPTQETVTTPAVKRAIERFKIASKLELKKLCKEGLDFPTAMNKIIDKLRSQHISFRASSKDIEFVRALSGFNLQSALHVLITREELLKLKNSGHSLSAAIDQLVKRIQEKQKRKFEGTNQSEFLSDDCEQPSKRIKPSRSHKLDKKRERSPFSSLCDFVHVNNESTDSAVNDIPHSPSPKRRHQILRDLDDHAHPFSRGSPASRKEHFDSKISSETATRDSFGYEDSSTGSADESSIFDPQVIFSENVSNERRPVLRSEPSLSVWPFASEHFTDHNSDLNESEFLFPRAETSHDVTDDRLSELWCVVNNATAERNDYHRSVDAPRGRETFDTPSLSVSQAPADSSPRTHSLLLSLHRHRSRPHASFLTTSFRHAAPPSDRHSPTLFEPSSYNTVDEPKDYFAADATDSPVRHSPRYDGLRVLAHNYKDTDEHADNSSTESSLSSSDSESHLSLTDNNNNKLTASGHAARKRPIESNDNADHKVKRVRTVSSDNPN